AMLEIPGSFWLAVAILLYAQARVPGRERAGLGAGLATAALFLCKYNYGLLWIVPVAIVELGLHHLAGLRRAVTMMTAIARGRSWRRPLPIFFISFALVLLGILVTGGGAFSLAGRRVSMRSPGNGAYVFYLLLLIAGLRSLARDRAGSYRRFAALPSRSRGFIAGLGIPLGVWFALPWPNRMKAFFDFVTNRSEAPATWLARLTYYPKALLTEYSPHPLVGAIALTLALVPPRPASVRGGRERRSLATVLYVALLVGLLVETLHRYQQPRFFAT